MTVPWGEAAAMAHAEYLAWSDPAPIRTAGDVQMSEVMAHLRKVLPADSVFCNGAGNYATWVHRFWPFRAYRLAARADLRLDGLWRSGCGRGQGAGARPRR